MRSEMFPSRFLELAVKTRAVLALGSNLGNREENLNQALEQIKNFSDSELLAVSSFHETVALTEAGEDETKPSYLNAVAILETGLTVEKLFLKTSDLEQQLGRVRETKWQDRTIDVDLISFGELELVTQQLTIPHPRAHERLFVLKPWLEVEPSAQLVGFGAIQDLVSRLEK
ncbi:MAG: 2-amino-4-hydroxy-6-hydroxymethyldihydropteridine diphosphokinase [Actinobacteria bacterium]|nr:2-amino-4-hydroxy-6-hydroxymethyldihydropteridine diphosphokinase [Actinomycetota bacterium]